MCALYIGKEMFKGIVGFFKEVAEELTKVTWATKQELVNASIIVVIASAIFTVYIFVIDSGLAKLMELFLKA
ncbi:MAG: preprotein translocase subunit SecE [Candidatus Omnitrophica bacterium]|nr:preprotein translocase subunit SecE [Candidatus Omnitrophota bacterium]